MGEIDAIMQIKHKVVEEKTRSTEQEDDSTSTDYGLDEVMHNSAIMDDQEAPYIHDEGRLNLGGTSTTHF